MLLSRQTRCGCRESCPDACAMLARAKNERDIVVRPPPQGWGVRAPPLLFMVHALLQALPKVIVAGVPSVQRAVISKTTSGRYTLLLHES